MTKRNLLIIIGVLVVVCAAVGVYMYMDAQEIKRIALEKKIRRETLIMAFDELPQTLNPLFEQNSAGLTLLDPIFDGLSKRSGKSVRDYRNGLAIDFIQDDKKHNIFVVELDPDKRWHDAPDHRVTSRDVRFTYECIVNENNASPLRGRINQLIKRIDIVDKFTLRVVFKEDISVHVVRDLLDFKIIPATYYGKAMSVDLRDDAVAQEFAKRPVGTGIFGFQDWQGNKIRYSLIGEPEVEEETEEGTVGQTDVVIRTIETVLVHDLEKQVRMLMDGKIDIILETSPELHEMMDGGGLEHAEYIPLHFYAIAFNTESPKFSNLLVRQAISRAINKVELAQQVGSGNVGGFINKSPFPHNDDRRYSKFRDLLPFNLKQAKRLLKKKRPFSASLIYQDDASKTMERLAGKLALMISELGITVESKGIGMAFDTQLANKTFELALVRHSGFTDGYNIAHLYRSGSSRNITGIGSKKLDRLLDQWENSAFWETRLPAAKKLHRLLLELSPYTYLFSLPTRAYYSPRLENVTIVDPNALLGSVGEWTAVPE
ncbi:MAG: ABC transporter substrate-binding protein [Proteobacteria bacterium]|nr:ABC transporter substrate-binding protein [Pseudomonadota bacterium]